MAANEGSLIALQVLDKMSASERWKEMKDDSSGFASDVETSLSKSMTSSSSCSDSHVVTNNRDAVVMSWDEASLMAPDSLRWDTPPAEDLSFDVFDCNDGGRPGYGQKSKFEPRKPMPGYLTGCETGSRCDTADFQVRTFRSPRSLPSSTSPTTSTACAAAVTPATSGLESAYSPRAKTANPNLKSPILKELVPNKVQKRKFKQSLAASADEVKAFTAYGASAKARLKHYVPLENDNEKPEAEFEFELEKQETVPVIVRDQFKHERACQSPLQQCIRNPREETFQQQQQQQLSPRHKRKQELYTDRNQPAQQIR